MIADWLERIDYSEIENGVEDIARDGQINMGVLPTSIHVERLFDRFTLYDASGHRILESTDKTVDTSALVPIP